MELDLQKTLELAIEWAKKAGEIQLSYFRTNNLGIETKSNVHDVVTKVDKECEDFLLHNILKEFPNHAVLGEETGEHKTDSDYLWVIDPLDGTNNYSQGLPIYSVSIGLQYKGITQLGVVYAPYLSELFIASRGNGAFLNGKQIHVSKKTELNQSVLGTGFPYDKDIHPANNADNLSRLLPNIRGVRRMGSAAYDLACVGAGFLDAYWELGLNLWDVCAGFLIVEEAGGSVVPFREDRGIAVIAGNEKLIETIRKFIE